MMRFLAPLLIFIAIGVLLWFGLGQDPHKLPSVLVGKPFPAFSLPALHDPTQTLTQETFKGKAALVNVWATWCVSCRAEHAALERIAKTHGVTIYGINYKDDRDEAQEWLRKLGDPYAVSVFDEQGRLGIDLGVYGTPETFIVDAQGMIRYRFAGPIDDGVWSSRLAPEIQKWQ
jgi:cytochrome c biogenesis protein CcmG, thiol:disulfide interchange protein DsbE